MKMKQLIGFKENAFEDERLNAILLLHRLSLHKTQGLFKLFLKVLNIVFESKQKIINLNL
jgi:hypothetical protein